jgi:hypothetical protein
VYVKVEEFGDFDTRKCHNFLKMTSKYACRKTEFFAWYKSLGINKNMIGAVLVIVGLFLVFFGNTYPELTSFGIIAISCAIIFRSFLAPIYKIDFLIALILGLIVAYFVTKNMWIIKVVLAIVIGFFLGNIIYNFVVKIFTGIDPDTLFLVTIFFCIALVFAFSYLVDTFIVIIATTLIGAYCAIRGLSICLGGFPDETYTSKLIINKEFNQLARVFNGKANLYLIAILLLFIIGLSVQGAVACLTGGEDKKEEEKKDNEASEPLKKGENKGETAVDVQTK